MNKVIAKQCLGVVALLCSFASLAASVEVIPSKTSPNIGDFFSVTVHGDGFPQTTGATLGLTFDGTRTLMMSVALASGSPFNAIVPTPASGHSCPPPGTACLISVLAPLSGTPPSGSFDAFVINFVATAYGSFNIALYDDSGDFSWTDANANPIPVTYTQADVGSHVPLPAAFWLLGSALGVLGWMKRKAAARSAR